MLVVQDGGLQTTVQDYPGRTGYWKVGIPPSGPMDALAFRVGNHLVGNSEGAAGLEMTATGSTLQFEGDAVVALTGAQMVADLDGQGVPWWESVLVQKGQVLRLGPVQGEGFRSYLLIRGGIRVPRYLGSRATFLFGEFGGYQGRALKAGDVLEVDDAHNPPSVAVGTRPPADLIPDYTVPWWIGAVPGPHEAPDYFTDEGVQHFFSAEWKVYHNSNRQGYRLVGPELEFARKDGGDGGHHPSNVHDYAYAIGTVNLSGNLPIVLTVDGPSLGGFVSIATIATSELWKIGQAAPGHALRFVRMTIKQATRRLLRQESQLAALANPHDFTSNSNQRN